MAVGKSKSLSNTGVLAAAVGDRMGTLDYGVDDMLRAISPPHVPLLSIAPLMIVIRNLMTRVRFAFCMQPSSPAGSYGWKKDSTISKGRTGRHRQATGWHVVNSATRRAGKQLGLQLRE